MSSFEDNLRLKEEKRDTFMCLPRELQLYIFSFLTQPELCKTASLVCRDWHKLTQDPVLWKSFSLNIRTRDDCANVPTSLLQRSSMLKTLKISSDFSLQTFASLSCSWPMLVHLDLGFCTYVDSSIIYSFAKHCPLIEILNVEGCNQIDRGAVYFISRLLKLRILNLSHCIFVDSKSINIIANKCNNLQDLNIDGITQITDSSVCGLAKNLQVALMRLILDCENLTDLTLQSISQLKNLRVLSLSFCDLLTDQSLMFVCSGAIKNLQRLKLKKASQISTRAIDLFFIGCHVQNLVSLELESMNIDDDGVYNITQNCKLLQLLSLPWCWEVTEVGLEHIVRHCHLIRFLDLLGLVRVRGLCLSLIPENLKQLEYLNLEQCNEIDDSVLVELVKNMPNVKVLNYYGELVIADSCLDC